jgi:hypothetical protein
MADTRVKFLIELKSYRNHDPGFNGESIVSPGLKPPFFNGFHCLLVKDFMAGGCLDFYPGCPAVN